MATVKQRRATRASLTALGVAAGIEPAQVYLLTDEGRLAVGLTTTAFAAFAKDTESGGAPWALKTANYTASSGDRILADTSGAAWTLTLPASGEVSVQDVAGTWSTKNLTVVGTIRGVTGNLVCDQSAALLFVRPAGASAWVVTKSSGVPA